MNTLRSVAVVLLVLAVIATGGTAIATAQDDAPGQPANFYGVAVDEDGTEVPVGTTIVAVVNGEVEGEITVDAAGEYGGDGAFDEKLSLDSAVGDEVSFHVEEASGPAAQESPVDLEAGTFEHHLTFPDEAFEYEPEPALEGIAVVLDDSELESGESTAVSVTAEFDTGETEVVTNETAISSGNTTVATVDDGTVTGEAAGTAHVSAEYTDGSVTETDMIEVAVEAASGSDPGPGPEPDPDPDPEPGPEHTLELLAEQNVDHDHACTHGDYDTRTPLDAGNSPDAGTVVDDDHVIWAVTYEGNEGYVTFDADGHWYDGPFVFYMADGSADPVDAPVLDSGGVPACDSLDSYVEVETPDNGQIVLELTGGETDSDPSLDPPGTQPDDEQPEAAVDVDPAEPSVGENVTLTANGSPGGDADIVGYEWTVGDEELTGEQVTTTFGEAGEKEIELTVENEHGETDTVAESITVLSESGVYVEIVEIDAPETVEGGSDINVTATIANAGNDAETVTITHTFDGGEQNNVTENIPGNGTKSVEFSVLSPETAGEYQHTIRADDDEKSVQTTVERADESDEPDDQDERDDGTEIDQPDETDETDEPNGADDATDDSVPGFTLLTAGGVLLVVVCVHFSLRRLTGDRREYY